ncbi:2-dehydropantoate 2-reductase [Marinomonas sp. M1K-6]|uniref:2-dehydropantoate 2-reductase n=1 Tax=Marinomonas profundi TaxID=2726122 RepID=A0A847RCZ9_9GAMM|nr:2-dehydropantoate 2-reductase [Marinomonas profundi]NLQ18914.1 2-dehydropantoate 2-reductase [Marinomonas profundi]UDV02851.1 2-dehydropantoate 2-reductase [Marinomonas profundi]
MKNSPWLIIGAGAIGLFWACKLEKLGHKVHLVYRSESPGKKITLESLTDETGQQQVSISKHKINSLKAEELTEQYDKVLICTKSFDLKNAFAQVAANITPEADVACLCNGIGAQEALQSILLDTQTLWAGTTSEGVLKVEVNHIKHTGLGDSYFGEWRPSTPAKVFPIESMTVINIRQRMIEKLAVNAVINPITAIFNIHNGDILNEEFKPLINATLSELASVFTHPQFSYAPESQHLTSDNLKNRVNTIAQLTRLNRSSMHEDIRLQRQTENSFISGFLLDNSPIELPVQRLLYEGVAFAEQREEVKKKLLSLP